MARVAGIGIGRTCCAGVVFSPERLMKQVTAGALFVRAMKSLPHSVQIFPLRWYSKPAQPACALQRIWHAAAVLEKPRYNC